MKKIDKMLIRNLRAENKLLIAKKSFIQKKLEPGTKAIKGKIPEKLKITLDALFEKAFYLVFEKGTDIIEKTYNKRELEAKHISNDYLVEATNTHRSFRNLFKGAKRSKRIGKAVALLEGGSLGLLGIGIPDIPIFTAVLLKGIYEISLNYGFDYSRYEEKIYILKLIQVALMNDNQKKSSIELDQLSYHIEKGVWNGSLESEIRSASRMLSEEMLLAKFIQGMPLVGVSGAFFNYSTYKKIMDLASVKYQKRYLEKKSFLELK